MDLGTGQTLTLGEGGLLASGTSASRVQGGTLRAGVNELVVTNRGDLTIASTIGEAVAGSGLTKSGEGTLVLTGTNTYSGSTAINQGRLVVSSDANLGTGSSVQFNGGTLVAAQSFTSNKGLSRGTTASGKIDTAGFDVTFSGANTGALVKTGLGTLTLSNPAAGTVTVSQGTLVLPGATSGSVTLSGGVLKATGNLTSLSLTSSSTLDIGGTGAASLTLGSISVQNGASHTFRFDLGISAQDLLAINNTNSLFLTGAPVFLFDFNDLGGVAIGTSYTLINMSTSGIPGNHPFAIAPSALAAGWNGTFTAANNKVSVTFTSTPEPGSALLVSMGAMILGSRRRRRCLR